MRILVVSDLPQFVTGGAEMQAARLIEAWLDAGHEVTCLGRRMGRGPIALGRHQVAVHRIHTASLFGRWSRAATYSLSLAWLLLRHRQWTDVVYTRFLGEAAITAALLKQVQLIHAPLIATPASTKSGGDVSFLRSIPFSAWLIRLLDRQCDAINLIAYDMAGELTEAGFSGNNFRRIPNGIPVRKLQERPATSTASFLAVGRLVPVKGYDILLHALALIRNILVPGQIRIVGDGPEREHLIALSQKLQLVNQIRWLGELPQDQVMYELERAQVFLLPSRYEGLSNAGLEAMERGLPLVLTRCGGLDLYVDERTGWVVPPGDAEALADALSQALAATPSTLTHMGARARAAIERNFDMTIVANRYITLFECLSNRKLRQ